MTKIEKSILFLFAFLLISLLVSCSGGEDLPCPISLDQMAAPEQDYLPYTIANDTCTTFCSVNISPRQCDDWGFDWIKDDSLRSGESITVYLPAGTYDVLLEDCTDLEVIVEKVRVDGETSLVLSDTKAENINDCEASVTVENLRDEPICYIWIATENSESFGSNWLGADQILPGESSQFYVIPGQYDLKAEGCDFSLLGLQLDTPIKEHINWTVE